jgi:hypothetical protein
LFQALEERARRLQKAIEETQAGGQIGGERLADLDRRLRHVQGEIAHMLGAAQDSGVRASLDALGRELEGVLRHLAEAPGGAP